MSSQPCILVLSNSEIPAGILREMLPRDSFPSVLFAASITAARRTLLAREVDLLVIDAPLQKESALRFAQEIAQRSTPGLLLLMGAELYHQQAARLEEAGIPVLPKPISKAMLQHSVRLLCTAQKRLYIAQRETMDLQQKMQEVRIIASAKRLMQEQLGWEEERAHRYLQKRAMDQCCTKYEAAGYIIQKLKNGGRL